MSDRLEALERRGEALLRFAEAKRQADAWIREQGTQALVDELRIAEAQRRPVRLATANVLVLLAHIDRLEAELSLAARPS